MGDNEKYPEWFLWLMEHRVRIFVVLAVASMVFLVETRSRERRVRFRIGSGSSPSVCPGNSPKGPADEMPVTTVNELREHTRLGHEQAASLR